MKRKVKRSLRMYSAWDYQREIEDLNRASEQGWQLVRGGSFHSKFVKNPDIRYRYQLDYRDVEDMGRYIETFREQGWEYVNSTFNGWHYFRKIYDPTQPEENYEIYTDRESLDEMNGRWAKWALIVGILMGAMALGYATWMWLQPMLPRLIQTLATALVCAVLLWGRSVMRKPAANRSRKGSRAFMPLFLTVVVLGLAATLALTALRPNFNSEQQTDGVDEPIVDRRWTDFVVRYVDNYYLDLSFEATEPMRFAVVNEAGETVYEESGTSFEDENIRLRLPAGSYSLSMSCESGYHLKCWIR